MRLSKFSWNFCVSSPLWWCFLVVGGERRVWKKVWIFRRKKEEEGALALPSFDASINASAKKWRAKERVFFIFCCCCVVLFRVSVRAWQWSLFYFQFCSPSFLASFSQKPGVPSPTSCLPHWIGWSPSSCPFFPSTVLLGPTHPLSPPTHSRQLHSNHQ